MGRQSDLAAIYGRGQSRLRANDAANIQMGAQHHGTSNYGIRINYQPEDNWWDALSSMMQGSHETSMKSLSDDNRYDEKEIEILDAASKISDDDISEALSLKDTYVSLEKEALLSGNSSLAQHYRQLAVETENTIKSYTQTRE